MTGLSQTTGISRRPAAAARRNNRKLALMKAAAECFVANGFAASTMREIAARAGMQPGSIYYHFPSKKDLLAAVHEEGLRMITGATRAALSRVGATASPWARLEAAAAAHMEMLLEGGVFFQALMRELPPPGSPHHAEVTARRDAYEAIFSNLLGALELPAGTDLRTLRLMLLGAMNWAHSWYRPGGDRPADIAAKFIRNLREGLEG